MDSQRRKTISNNENKSIPDHSDLPFDVIVSNIISKLPVKLIIQCKSLSKAFKIHISHPSFSNVYETNKSHSLCTIFVDDSKPNFFPDLVEYDIRDIYSKRGSSTIPFDKEAVVGGINNVCNLYFQIRGHCNGLFFFLKYKSGLCDFFVTNPILGELIQLPEPLARRHCMASGLGYCPLSNSYKILRVSKEHGRGVIDRRTEIFTIGRDQNWRSISDVSVPYNATRFLFWRRSPLSMIVPFRSALHWIMESETIEGNLELGLCAFDMTEEKARVLPLPRNVVARRDCICSLSVSLDKICVLQFDDNENGNLWVMNNYGVEGTWRKKLILKKEILGLEFCSLRPLAVSPGMFMVTDGCKLLIYEMKQKKWRDIPHNKRGLYPIPFVPGFVSLKSLVPGLMIDNHH